MLVVASKLKVEPDRLTVAPLVLLTKPMAPAVRVDALMVLWLNLINILVMFIGILELPEKGVVPNTEGGMVLVIDWLETPVVKVAL